MMFCTPPRRARRYAPPSGVPQLQVKKAPKHNCKQRSSTVSRKLSIASKKIESRLKRVVLVGHIASFTQARKRHINILFLSGWSWVFTGFVPGQTQGQTQGQTRWKPGTNPCFPLMLHSGSPANPGLSLGQTRGRPWDKPGDEARHRKFMWKKFMCLFRSLFTAETACMWCVYCKGWLQIGLFLGHYEGFFFQQKADRAPGDFEGYGFLGIGRRLGKRNQKVEKVADSRAGFLETQGESQKPSCSRKAPMLVNSPCCFLENTLGARCVSLFSLLAPACWLDLVQENGTNDWPTGEAFVSFRKGSC